MGCTAGKAPYRERLDDVEEQIKLDGGRADAESLASLARGARELREVFEQIVAAGACDVSAIRNIEVLGDKILSLLERRITAEFVQSSDFNTHMGEMAKIATDLDAIRATSATLVLRDAVSRRNTEICAAKEAQARKPFLALRQTMDAMKGAPAVLSSAGKVLDLAEEAHRIAPESTRVTDSLLKAVVELASRVIDSRSVWTLDPEKIRHARQLAGRVDDIAGRLVLVVSATWDPPMAPEVERLLLARMAAVCTETTDLADKDIADANCGAAYDRMDTLKPLWPEIRNVDGATLQVLGVFGRIEAACLENFIGAVQDKRRDEAVAIQEFAKKYEELRNSFEGLPKSANGNLETFLKIGGRMSTIETQLASIEAALPKCVDDEASFRERVATLLQTFETAATLWGPVADKAAADLGARTNKARSGMEAWAYARVTECGEEKALETPEAIASPPFALSKKVKILLGFAERYDASSAKFEKLPPLEAGPLYPRVAARVAPLLLKLVEVQLGRGADARIDVALDSLAAASRALPGEGVPGGLGPRLRAVIDGTAEWILGSFSVAVAERAPRREEAVLQAAARFDAAGLATRRSGKGADAAPLATELQVRKEEAADAFVASLKEAAAGGAPLIAALLEVRSARYFAEQLAGSEPRRAVLAEALQELSARTERAVEELRTAGLDGADKALDAAQDADTTLAELPECVVTPPKPTLRARIVVPCFEACMQTLSSMALCPEPVDLSVVRKGLVTMKRATGDGGRPKQVVDAFQAWSHGPLKSMLVRAVLADERGGLDVSEITLLSDGICGVEGDPVADPASLSYAMDELRQLALMMRRAREEVQKEKGVDPRQIVGNFQAMVPFWAAVSAHEPFRTHLIGSFDVTETKFQDACRKAFVVGEQVDKKLDALSQIAGEVTKVQNRLLQVSAEPFTTRDFQNSVSKVILFHWIQQVETELGKVKGLDPMAVLYGLRQTSSRWNGLPKEDPEVKKRLSEAVVQARSRLAISYEKAYSDNDNPKMEKLKGFANEFDLVCAVFGEEIVGATTMAQNFQGVSKVVLLKQIEQVETELGKEEDFEPDAILIRLRETSSRWNGLPKEDPEVKNRLSEAVVQTRSRLVISYEKAYSDSDNPKMEKLKEFANEFDLVCAVFGEDIVGATTMTEAFGRASSGLVSSNESAPANVADLACSEV